MNTFILVETTGSVKFVICVIHSLDCNVLDHDAETSYGIVHIGTY